MAADLAAAIKRCKLSPEAGAAELRKALEETDELASAADAAAAAAASLKSGSATARGHALAACILLAGLVEDADAAADAVAAVLETATDWAARGALAGGIMALAANAGDGAGFVRAAKATAAAATKASGGGDDAAAAAARAACWAACAVCGASLSEPVADVTKALSSDLKTAAAPASRSRAPAALRAAASLLHEGPGDEPLEANASPPETEKSPWVASLREALPALEALAPKAPPKKPKAAGPAYAAAQNVLALLSATPKARAKTLGVAATDGGAVLFGGADASSKWAAASVLRRAFEGEAVASFASVSPHCWRGLARAATTRDAS